MQPELFSRGEPIASRADAVLARMCRYHARILAQSRHAPTRSQADRVARSLARQVSDPALRERLYREIVTAANPSLMEEDGDDH